MKQVIAVLMFCSFGLWAQTDNDLARYRVEYPAIEAPQPSNLTTNNTPATASNVSFNLNIDSQVATIIDTIRENNKQIKKAKGYRIVVYHGSDKEEIRKVKELVYSIYPDINIISEYKQPDYKIRFGDFLSRVDAFEALGRISSRYPDALVVPEIVDINPPKK